MNKGAIFNTSSKEKLAADVSAVVCDMLSNGEMWNVSLFPGFGDATIKKFEEILTTNAPFHYYPLILSNIFEALFEAKFP